MNTYHPYNNDWNDPYDRPVPGYIFQNPAPAPAAPSSFGRSAAIAAVLVGTIGAGAVLGWALFGHTNTSAAATRPATIELPGPVPGTPQAPGAPAPVIIQSGPAQVIPVPDSDTNGGGSNGGSTTGGGSTGGGSTTGGGSNGGSTTGGGTTGGSTTGGSGNGGSSNGGGGNGGGNPGDPCKGWDPVNKTCGGSNGGGSGNGSGNGPGTEAWCVKKGGVWDSVQKKCK